MHDVPTTDLQTPAATRVALRTFFRISEAWQLDGAEEAILLGELPAIVGTWRERPPEEPLPRATLERLSHLFGIYASLVELFQDPSRAHAWLRRPNTAPLFGGDTALARMLLGDVDDLQAVREYLEAQFDH
ncbi:DUF2384 domain-containing protein [Lysobacter arenosi]|uniref:DUF2384 domain-containing protein n=1 Tax=Lysobacter arenosi TaxID=2795387 RepID=A0ABX7R8K3_9GAMM|nr:MbcA/ParS/Xre antitoxin family protein [Lysobacter arenosi]QSX74435.1 DUF2384 domain-containing protein [Lysobacter arenosi]